MTFDARCVSVCKIRNSIQNTHMQSICKILEGLDSATLYDHPPRPTSPEEEDAHTQNQILIRNRRELDRVGYLGQAGIPRNLQNPIKDVQTDSTFGGSNDMKRFGIGGFRDASVYALQAEIRNKCDDVIDIERSARTENIIRKNMKRAMSDIKSVKPPFRVLDFRPRSKEDSDLSFNFHSSNKIEMHIPKYVRHTNSFRIIFGGVGKVFSLQDNNVESKELLKSAHAEDEGLPFSPDRAAHLIRSGVNLRFGWESSNPTLVEVASQQNSSFNNVNNDNGIEEISSPSSMNNSNKTNGRVLKQTCAWTMEISKGQKYVLQLRIASHCPRDDDDDMERTATSSSNQQQALRHLTLNDTNILHNVTIPKDKRIFEVVVLLENCNRVTLSMDNNDKIILISACLYGPFGNVTKEMFSSSSSSSPPRHSKALRLGQSLCRHVLTKDNKLNTSLFFSGVKHFLKRTPTFSTQQQDHAKSPFRHVGQWLASAAKDIRLSRDARASAIHVLVEMTTAFDHIDLELLVASTLCELSDLEMSLRVETLKLLRNRHGVAHKTNNDKKEEEETDKTLSSLHILLESLHRNIQSKIKVSSEEMIEMVKFGLSVIRRCMSKNQTIASKSLRFVHFLLRQLDYSVNENETLSQKLFRVVPGAAVRHIIIKTLCMDSTRSVCDLRVFLDRALMVLGENSTIKRQDIKDEVTRQMESDTRGDARHFLHDSKYIWQGPSPSLEELEYVDQPLQVMDSSLREKIEETLSVAIELYTNKDEFKHDVLPAVKEIICSLLPLASSRHRTKLCESLFDTSTSSVSTKEKEEEEDDDIDSKRRHISESETETTTTVTSDPNLDNFLQRLEREKLGQSPNNSWWDISTVQKGDYVDVLDTYGWWWVGEVVHIFEDEEDSEDSEVRFEIRYRGFNPRWNEEVVANGGRISRLGTHTGEITRDGVSVLDPETEVKGYRILFLNVNNVPQRSGIVEKIAWSDGWIRPENDKTPPRYRGWQKIDKEPMWVPSKSCSHAVRSAKLQWLIRWDGTSEDNSACWVDAQRVNPERPRDEVFCFVLDPKRTNLHTTHGLSSFRTGNELVGCRLLRFATNGVVSDSTSATRWEESSILAYASPAQVPKDSSYDRQESEGGKFMLGGPQGILETENAPFKKRTAVLIRYEVEILLRSLEWQVQSKSGEWQAMRFIPQYSVERAFREKRKWLQIVDDNEIWQITFDDFADRSIQEYTMQRRQPIFTRENTVREEIQDVRNVRRVRRVLPSRAHQNSSAIIRDHIDIIKSSLQSNSNMLLSSKNDVEQCLLEAQKEALVVSHGLGLAWRDWNETTMVLRNEGYVGVPLAAVVFVDQDPITRKSILNVEGEDYVYASCRVTKRSGWLPLKFLNPARPFKWNADSLRIGDWIDARFNDDRWHVAQIVQRHEDGFTVRAHDELTRCDWQHVRVIQTVTDGVAFFGQKKEIHRGNRYRELVQQVARDSRAIAPLGTKCARDQWTNFLEHSYSKPKSNKKDDIAPTKTKTSTITSSTKCARSITHAKIQSSFLHAVSPEVLDSSTTSSAVELISSTIHLLRDEEKKKIDLNNSITDISETFLWRMIDSKMNLNPELLFHALERLTVESRSLGSVLNLVLSLSRPDVRNVKMRSSSILDIVRNAYFVTTTYSRHSKRVGVISSQRIEAENRIAALFEENVRRRGEESTTSSAENPTLEEIASFFKIPLDALIQCLNGLGPEVQLLMTALSLGTSSIGEILLSRIRRCILEKHGNIKDIDQNDEMMERDCTIPGVYRLVFPETLSSTPRNRRSTTTTNTTTTTSTTSNNEEAKISSKNNRETKTSAFEMSINNTITAEQMSVELLGSVANLAQRVASRGPFFTTENFFCMSTRPKTFSTMALLLNRTWSRVQEQFTTTTDTSAALLVSCLKLTGANLKNLLRIRDTASNFKSIRESLNPTLSVLADMSRHLLGVSFESKTFRTILDRNDMMDASKNETLATVLAQTIRICIPFFLENKQVNTTLKFFNTILGLASTDVHDRVFLGRTRLLIDLMENMEMPIVHDDVFQLAARLLYDNHEESQALYRAVNRFVLSHQLGVLANSSSCLAGSFKRMTEYSKQLVSLALSSSSSSSPSNQDMLAFLLHPYKETKEEKEDKPTSVLGSFLCALSCLPSTILLNLIDILPDFVNLLSLIRPSSNYTSESQRRVVERWLSHVIGRVSQDLITGPSLILSECDLSMWLKLPMFLGGLCDTLHRDGDNNNISSSGEISLWSSLAENDDVSNNSSFKKQDRFEIFQHTTDLDNFDVPELDGTCRYVPNSEDNFEDVLKKCSKLANKYEECVGFQIHRDMSSFERVRYVVFKAANRLVHESSRTSSNKYLNHKKNKPIVTYIKREFGTIPSLSSFSFRNENISPKSRLEHLDWLFQVYTSWTPSKASKSDLWCLFQALLRRGGAKAMAKFRRLVKDRKVVRCWSLVLASLLHHSNTAAELRDAWDQADHKNLPIPLTSSLRNVAKQFARILKQLNREKAFWSREDLLRAEERRSQQLVPPSPRMSPMRTPPHSPSSIHSFFLSSPRNASSPRNNNMNSSESKILFEKKDNDVPDTKEPVGSCDATTRLRAAVSSNWPDNFEEHLNQTIQRALLSLKLLPASEAIKQSTRGPRLEKLATQQQSLLPSSLQESDKTSYDQLQWLVSRQPSQSRVWDHMSSLLQSYNRRNSYSMNEDEEYVHEDDEFVGLESTDVALHSVSSFLLLGTGVRIKTMEQVLRRRTIRAKWRCEGLKVLNRAFNETHVSSAKAILIRNLSSGLASSCRKNDSHHLSRHHASCLHGCSQVLRRLVASKFADLCADLVSELASCYAAGNMSLTSHILQFWSDIDIDLLDIPFVYGLGIVPLIQKLGSFESLNETATKNSSSKSTCAKDDNMNDAPPAPPSLRCRDSKEVRDGLISGSITKEDVVRHLKTRLSHNKQQQNKNWIRAQLQGSVRDAVNRHTTSSLSALYRVIEYESDMIRRSETESKIIEPSKSQTSNLTALPPPLPEPRITPRSALDPLPLVRVRSIDQGRHDLQLHWWSTHMGSLPVISESPSSLSSRNRENHPIRLISLLLYQKILRSVWTLTVGCNTIYDPPPCTETVNRETLISTSANERMMIRQTSHMRAIQKSIERSTKSELRFVTRQIGPLKARLEDQLVELMKRDLYLAAKTLSSTNNKKSEDLSQSATKIVRTHAATICAMCRCTCEIDVTMMLARMLLKDADFVTSLATLLQVVSSNEICVLLRALRALLVVSPSSTTATATAATNSVTTPTKRRGGYQDRLLSDVFSLKISLDDTKVEKFGPWLIEWLLETIGTARTGKSTLIDTTEIGGSVAKKRVASEAVMLYRAILELPIWRITASMRVEQSLRVLLRDETENIAAGIATLDILGGFARTIRPGHVANVRTDNTNENSNDERKENSKRELAAAIVLDHSSGTHSRSRVLFFSGQSDSVILRTAEMRRVPSRFVITQNEDEIVSSKLVFTTEQLEIFVRLLRDVKEDSSIQRYQIRTLAIRAMSEQLKVEKNAESVFGHELQLLLMNASLKCPKDLRESSTKSSVLTRWNDTENLYLDVHCLENSIVFEDMDEENEKNKLNKKKGEVFQIHGDEADTKLLETLYEECERKYSRQLCSMAIRLYPRICSDRKGKILDWLLKWGSTYTKDITSSPSDRTSNIPSSKTSELLEKNSYDLSLHDIICEPECLVGLRVAIRWLDDVFYEGKVSEYSSITQQHHVSYDDGDQRWYDWATRFSGSSIDDWHLIKMSETELLSLVPRRRSKILEFIRVAPDADRRTACYYLQQSCFHSQRALQNYFDSGHHAAPNSYLIPSEYVDISSTSSSPTNVLSALTVVSSTKEEEDNVEEAEEDEEEDDDVLQELVEEASSTTTLVVEDNTEEEARHFTVTTEDDNTTVHNNDGTRYTMKQLEERPLLLVGHHVSVLWDDMVWYTGEVLEYDHVNRQYHVVYEDGDERWYDWAVRFSKSRRNHWRIVHLDPYETGKLHMIRKHAMEAFVAFTFATTRTAVFFLLQTNFDVERAIACFFAEAKAPPTYWKLPQWVFYNQTLMGGGASSIECQHDQDEEDNDEVEKEEQHVITSTKTPEDDLVEDDEENEEEEEKKDDTSLEPAAEALAHAAQSVVIQIAEKVAALSRDTTTSNNITSSTTVTTPSLSIDLDTVMERLKSSNVKEKLKNWNMYFKRRIRSATRTMTLDAPEFTLSETLGKLCTQEKLEKLSENLEHIPKDLQHISYLALLHVEHSDNSLPERVSGFSVNSQTGEVLLHSTTTHSLLSSSNTNTGLSNSKKEKGRVVFPLVQAEEWITFTRKEIDTPPSAPSMILRILKDRCIVLPLMAQKSHVQENLVVFVQELLRSQNVDEKHVFSGRGAVLASTILKIDSIMQWDHIQRIMSSIAIRVAARNYCWLHPKEREKLRRNFHDAVSVWGSCRKDFCERTARELEISETQSTNLMSLLHLIEMDEDRFSDNLTFSLSSDTTQQQQQQSSNIMIFEDATESQDPTVWCRTSSCEHVSDAVVKTSKMSTSKSLLSAFMKTRFAQFCSSQVSEDTKPGSLVVISETTLRGNGSSSGGGGDSSSNSSGDEKSTNTMRLARLIRVRRGSFLVRFFDVFRDCIVEKYVRATDCRVLKRLWGLSVNSRTHLRKALNSTSSIVASMAARQALVRLLLTKVTPNAPLTPQDANRCIHAFGGASSLMQLVKIMVASDGPLFVRDRKSSRESSRRSVKLRHCLKHLLLSEATTLKEGDVERVKDTLIYEVKLQTLKHCRTSKTTTTTTPEAMKKKKKKKKKEKKKNVLKKSSKMTLESLHPLFVASRSMKQCFVVFSEESFMELTLSKYQLSSDMRLRVYAIGRSSQHRSICELESVSQGEPFLDIVGDDAMHENEAEVSKLFIPFSSVLVELSMKTKRKGITNMWGYRIEFNSLDVFPSNDEEEYENNESTIMMLKSSDEKKAEIWSMEWGSWLLQILLEVEMIHLKSSKKSRPIRILARAELTKSMIHYLRTPGAQNKDLVIRLLTDLLRQYTLDTNERDDDCIMPLNDLKRVGRLTMNLIRNTIGNEDFIPQKRLQLLVELALVTDLADNKLRPPEFLYTHLEFVSSPRDDDGYTLGHAQQGPWHLLRSNPMLILWRRISVYWAGERRWFKGTVTHFSYPLRYTIEYDDGDVRERNFEDLFRQNPKWKWRMLPQNVTLLEAVKSTEKVKEKCDVYESGVGVLDVTKGERLIGVGHIEREEEKWWCGHTVDGSKTGIFPVSAVREIRTGDWCLFANLSHHCEDMEGMKKEDEEEKKDNDDDDDEYVGDREWLKVKILDQDENNEENDDEITTDNDATATDDGTDGEAGNTEDDVEDEVLVSSSSESNITTTNNNNSTTSTTQTNNDSSSNRNTNVVTHRSFRVRSRLDNSRRYHRNVRISTSATQTIPILQNLRGPSGLESMFESSRLIGANVTTGSSTTRGGGGDNTDRWTPRTFFGAISSNESIWIRLGQILLAQHRQQRLDHVRERSHVRESDRQAARTFVAELEETTKTISSHVLENILKSLVRIANSLLSEEESEEKKRDDQSVNLRIVGWINDLVAKGKVTSFATVKPKHVVKLLNKISESDDKMGRLVESRGIPNILRRMGVLQRFNRLLRYRNVQRLIDMSSSSMCTSGLRPESLGDKFRLLGPLVFLENKMSLLETALNLTKCDDMLGELVIDQYLAMQSAERKLTHPSQSHSIFCQAFRSLHGRDHRLFRSAQLQQSIHVTFRRSPVVDAGGVFRETMSSIIESVFSDQISLLIPTPNQTSGTGLGQDLFVPNPDATTPLEIRMFEFLGIMLGIAIRNTFPMPFRFPELIYRRILRDDESSELVVDHVEQDLRQVDQVAYDLLEAVRKCESEGVTNQDEFEEMFGSQLLWTTNSVSGATVALRKNVATPVRFEERSEYCDAVYSYRHKELQPSLRAMRRGLSTVVPMAGLQLFTASEFEVLVCGALEIDWKYLRRHTKYENYRRSSRAVRWFWKIFREMSQKERSLFIKYVWGRQRLPRGNEVWKQPFLISRCPDINMLPVAHTCFFKIDLPPYPTIEEMREKIHTAMASANAPISMLLA